MSLIIGSWKYARSKALLIVCARCCCCVCACVCVCDWNYQDRLFWKGNFSELKLPVGQHAWYAHKLFIVLTSVSHTLLMQIHVCNKTKNIGDIDITGWHRMFADNEFYLFFGHNKLLMVMFGSLLHLVGERLSWVSIKSTQCPQGCELQSPSSLCTTSIIIWFFLFFKLHPEHLDHDKGSQDKLEGLQNDQHDSKAMKKQPNKQLCSINICHFRLPSAFFLGNISCSGL